MKKMPAVLVLVLALAFVACERQRMTPGSVTWTFTQDQMQRMTAALGAPMAYEHIQKCVAVRDSTGLYVDAVLINGDTFRIVNDILADSPDSLVYRQSSFAYRGVERELPTPPMTFKPEPGKTQLMEYAILSSCGAVETLIRLVQQR